MRRQAGRNFATLCKTAEGEFASTLVGITELASGNAPIAMAAPHSDRRDASKEVGQLVAGVDRLAAGTHGVGEGDER